MSGRRGAPLIPRSRERGFSGAGDGDARSRILGHAGTVTLALADAMPAVARYAGRFHLVAGEHHHVASPLGAWLLLALCGPASSGPARAELTEVLGCDVDQAAALAARLLSAPHPLVAVAAAFWRRAGVSTGALSRWLQTLPGQVETGTLTDQAALDAWARRSTFGLIRKFPVDLSPDVLLMLATALATKVSWQQPFDMVPAATLGPHSPWASELGRVLRTPAGPGHNQFIATTSEAGDVAVHTAWARDGLQVTSVAAQPGVPAGDVIAAAYRLASAMATGGVVARRSLFTLPLGPAPLWEVTEQPMRTMAPDGREERCTAVLPAWSAESGHDLTGHASLGFPAAAKTLAALIRLDRFRFEAKQAAVARYSRTGFEAAAVTGLAVATAMPVMRPGRLRTAELRFGQPFAVIAVTTGQDDGGSPSAGGPGPWHGLPVFSAWITRPQDAAETAATV
jgi:hypothetical protein